MCICHSCISFYLLRNALLSPLCVATKPFDIVATVLLAPHELHSTKNKREACSLTKFVSGDLHILHVTYSPMYFFNNDSIFLGTNVPLKIKRALPSVDPVVPSSVIKY